MCWGREVAFESFFSNIWIIIRYGRRKEGRGGTCSSLDSETFSKNVSLFVSSRKKQISPLLASLRKKLQKSSRCLYVEKILPTSMLTDTFSKKSQIVFVSKTYLAPESFRSSIILHAYCNVLDWNNKKIFHQIQIVLIFYIVVSVRPSSHCSSALDLGASVEQPFDCLISRTVKPCSPGGGRWVGHWRTTWSTVCSSAPHSQAAEEAIPHLCKQEQKLPTPVRRRLKRTPAILGRVIPGVCAGVGDESVESRKVVQPLRVPLVIRPLRRTYVTVVWWNGELLCAGCKRVSRFKRPCIHTRWTGEADVQAPWLKMNCHLRLREKDGLGEAAMNPVKQSQQQAKSQHSATTRKSMQTKSSYGCRHTVNVGVKFKSAWTSV